MSGSSGAVITVQFEVLGSVGARAEDCQLELGGSRRRDLLAILLVQRGNAVTLGALADRLWQGRPPATAIRTLRAHVSHLRAALGDASAIETIAGGYRVPGDVVMDADLFERDVSVARLAYATGDLQGAWEAYGAAVGRWRGPAYGDMTLDLLDLTVERQRLDALRLETERERARIGLELGHHEDVMPVLRALVTRHPLDESLAQLLASALYEQDRQTEALEMLRDLRDALRDELGLEPTSATRDLELAVLRHELPTSSRTRDRVVGPVAVPVPLGVTVGRAEEIAQICGLLADNRLVTLVGPGGVGKTRLALESAQAAQDGFRDGAGFVDFAAVRDEDTLVEHLASSLGISGQVGRGTKEGVVAFFRSRGMLLVLDNCEHLIEPIGGLAEWLARVDPELRILATSRERMGRPGEVVVEVQPLFVGEEGGGGAVELYVQNARRRASGFSADQAELQLIADICRRVDGLPLAIELAAARSAGSSSREILDLLADDPVMALSRGLRTADARHRSLDATVRWSYDQLDAQRRAILRAVSVFAGPFSWQAADAVCTGLDGEVVRTGLEDLVECSLLTASQTTDGTRYGVLETIRAFGTRELDHRDELASTRSAHLHHHLRLARGSQYGLMTDMRWFSRLEEALPDLRAAFWHALRTGQIGASLWLSASLALFMTCRHFNEGSSWVEAALDLAGRDGATVDEGARTAAIAAHASYRCLGGDLQGGREEFDEAIDLYRRQSAGDARRSSGLMWTLHWSGFHPPADEPAVAAEQASAALQIARATADPVATFYLSVRLAESLLVEASHARGDVTMSERQRIQDMVTAAFDFADNEFGDTFDGFGKVIGEAVAGMTRALDDEEGLASAENAVLRLHRERLGPLAAGRLISLGQLSMRAGRPHRARELIQLGLGWIADTGFTYPTRAGLLSVAALLVDDDPATAAVLLGAAVGRPADLHSHYAFVDEREVLAGVRQRLAPSAFEEAQARGASLTHKQAITLAMDIVTPT